MMLSVLVGGATIALLSILYGSLTIKLLTLLAALVTWRQLKRPQGIPPGPRGLPIIGYIPSVAGHIGEAFHEVSKKYGPIYSVYLGNKLTIILHDYAHIKKALVDNAEVFSGRPEHMRKEPGRPDNKALIYHDGPLWKEHRRFALATLREYGIGKSSIEPALQNEIHYFLQAIQQEDGKPFDINDLLGMSVCNNICIMEYGKRFEYDDPYFLELKHAVDGAIQGRGARGSLMRILIEKFLLYIPYFRNQDRRRLASKKVDDFSQKLAVEHSKTYQSGSKSDYIDAYFTEREQRKKLNNNVELFDDVALYQNLVILFMAGTETTATTLRWGFLFMMMHPDIQRKVQQEIDDVIGRHRLPTMEDKLRMPYTDATLLEIARRGTIVPMSVPHSTLEEIELGDYRIPKRTTIMTNLWAVHHDENLFPDPFSFRPERFINERGQFVKHEAVIPFSLGKRFCLGEPLARMELFLYFTSILQKFTIVNPDDQVLTQEAINTSVHGPKSFKLRAIQRND